MILEHIDRLRSKPPEVRKRIALSYAALVTGCVGLVWLSVLMFGTFAPSERGVGGAPVAATPERNIPDLGDIRGIFNASNVFLGADVVNEDERSGAEADVVGAEGSSATSSGGVLPVLPPQGQGIQAPDTATTSEEGFLEGILREVEADRGE